MKTVRPVALLKRFYAVTLSRSVYVAQITYTGTGDPFLQKIAVDGKSCVALGEKMTGGSMVAIARRLHMFVPEGGGYTSFQREITKVNNRWWGENTSAIVALFLQKQKALNCLKGKDFVFCDSRWEQETIKVLKRVGNDHPHCAISDAMPDFWLIPPEKWQ